MRKYLLSTIGSVFFMLLFCSGLNAQPRQSEYVVLVRETVRTEAGWKKIIDKLVEMHQAEVVTYRQLTSEALPRLRDLDPRYVAIVEKPENIKRDFVVDLNRMSRKIDNDIYADFFWGIITGYNADAALRLVVKAETPKVASSAWCVGATDFQDGKYFERMGLNAKHFWVEKNSLDSPQSPMDTIAKSIYWGMRNNPDIVIWETPGQTKEMFVEWENYGARVVSRDGRLWLGDRELKLQDNARVCFLPMVYGGIENTGENFPMTWLNSQGVGALVSGVEYSAFDKGVWGTLQFWLTDAGRFSLAEAQFLNQQAMSYWLKELDPEALEKPYEYAKEMPVMAYFDAVGPLQLQELGGKANVLATFNTWYERDLMVYYGDPAWNVRAKDMRGDQPYSVSCKVKGKKCTVTIQTNKNYTWDRLCGDIITRVGELPVCYIFPERLKNPRLVKKNSEVYKIVVDENFLFIHDAFFQPDKKYQIEIEIDR